MINNKFQNNYLAKSNPRETIQEHTDKLLKNFEILKNIWGCCKLMIFSH